MIINAVSFIAGGLCVAILSVWLSTYAAHKAHGEREVVYINRTPRPVGRADLYIVRGGEVRTFRREAM